MAIKKWKALKEKIRSSEGYWVERAKNDFTAALHELMKRKKISKAGLARKLDISAPYVTRVMSGDENLTIESMVKFARAVDGQLHLHISDQRNHVSWFECETDVSFDRMMRGFREYSAGPGRSVESSRVRTRGSQYGNVQA